MSAVQPTKNTGLIVDEFIRYANNHLLSVRGMITTVSGYPGPTTAPGVVDWKGYQVAGAKNSRDNSSNANNDLFIGEDANPNNTPLTDAQYLAAEESLVGSTEGDPVNGSQQLAAGLLIIGILIIGLAPFLINQLIMPTTDFLMINIDKAITLK